MARGQRSGLIFIRLGYKQVFIKHILSRLNTASSSTNMWLPVVLPTPTWAIMMMLVAKEFIENMFCFVKGAAGYIYCH